MRRSVALAALTGLFLLSPALHPQTAPSPPVEASPSFEVASIKQIPGDFSNGPGAYGFFGGPGSPDPGQFRFVGPLKSLAIRALGVKTYQFSSPDWLAGEAFQIVAKLPPDTTPDQFEKMLLNLVVERFHLAYHHESREMSVYELLIAKDGAKLKESGLSGPSHFIGRMTNGLSHTTAGQQPISGLTAFLESYVDRPVVDKTGLTGKYDIQLTFSRDGLKNGWQIVNGNFVQEAADDSTPSGGPSLFKALQDQLGLKLESARDPIDVLVLDHIDRLPTEN